MKVRQGKINEVKLEGLYFVFVKVFFDVGFFGQKVLLRIMNQTLKLYLAPHFDGLTDSGQLVWPVL